MWCSSRCQQDSAIRVMTSVDCISNILASFVPPDSPMTQAWFSSLSLVHSSWSQPVFFALRQHPIISSTTQFLSFQDSFRIQLDRLGTRAEHTSRHDRDANLEINAGPARTGVPSACAVRSMTINLSPPNFSGIKFLEKIWQERLRIHLQLSKELYLDPSFFSSLSNLSSLHLSLMKISIHNFTFLLSNFSGSLIELGIHDVNFVGSNRSIFDPIFDITSLKSLSLTGWLARVFVTVLQKRPQNLDTKQSLENLCLSNEGSRSLDPNSILRPQHLLSCWSSYLEVEGEPTVGESIELEDDIYVPPEVSNPKYPNPLKIMNYRLCTRTQEWHQPRKMKDLREVGNQFGIQIEVIHPPSDTLGCIKCMSRYT